MALRIAQDFEYEGNDWWKWSVWLEGDEAELDRVKAVTYILHPSFPRPVRTVTERKDNFRLRTAGWGTFLLHAKVALEGGAEEILMHELQLFYPDNTAAPA